MVSYSICKTPFGWCGVVADRQGLKRLFLPDFDRHRLAAAIRAQYPGCRDDGLYGRDALEWMAAYAAGAASPPPQSTLDMGAATPFQRAVWGCARDIPRGQVRTYRRLARSLGKPSAARAVGRALGRNPFPLFVPCHRIVRSDGSLGGFSAAGGPGLKQRLLELEGVRFTPDGRVVL